MHPPFVVVVVRCNGWIVLLALIVIGLLAMCFFELHDTQCAPSGAVAAEAKPAPEMTKKSRPAPRFGDPADDTVWAYETLSEEGRAVAVAATSRSKARRQGSASSR